MTPRPLQGEFPFATYRDYVSALAATDNAYQRLGQFLSSTSTVGRRSSAPGQSQVPNTGSVTLIDHVDGTTESQHFALDGEGSKSSAKDCICALDERPVPSMTRVILLSYHREPFTGEYTGVNTDVLDSIGKKFRVHPEVLMWHFGSDYGLDRRFFLNAKSPLPSALSNRTFCHLQNDNSLFSCCLSTSDGATNPDTVVIFSRNHEFPNWSLLTSRLMFLDSSLPMPSSSRKSVSRWSNTLFVRALQQNIPEDASADANNPIEFIMPYAQMILINATSIMDLWAMKVMHPQGKTSSNLEVHYDKQVALLNEMRSNYDALKIFTTNKSSQRWKNMLWDYERVLQSTEQQINVVLAQKMTYRAAMASLDESRMGIEHAKRGMEQNARVKRLTQLALIFIPLSFSTSLFGMNLEMLGTGTAKVWMVGLAIVSAYVATSLLWIVIDYENIKDVWMSGLSQQWWPLRLFYEKNK